MIVPKEIAENVQAPQTPMEMFEIIHNISLYLLEDDKHDLGRFVYYDRDDHYYHGRHSPHHPSPFHHWQIGVMGLLFSQLGALMTKARELFSTYEAVTTGDYSAIDNDIIELAEDNNTISLQEYQEEIAAIPSVPNPKNNKVAQKSPQNKKLMVPKVTGLPGY